jgi:hypothetical protein
VCYIWCTYGLGILVNWRRYWLGNPHTFSKVSFRLVWEGRVRRVIGFRVAVASLKLTVLKV